MEEPIRILQCVQANLSCGGIESFIMNVYRNIDRTKIQFDFLVHGNNENYYEDEVKKLGGKIYRVPLVRNYTKYKKEMKKFLTENNYQTIHIHSAYSISYFDAKIAKECNIKNVIVHCHSTGTNGKKRRIIHTLLKNRIDKKADYKFSCSNEAARWMFSNKTIKNKNYTIIKNAINTSKYQYNEELREKARKELKIDNNFVVGHVGRLSSAKNQLFLLEIFKEILQIKNNAKLLLVGDGELKERIIEKAQQLNIKNDIILIGNSDKVEQLLNAMDVFVFPSIYEGFGLSILEAQITGLSCFVSNRITKEVNITGLVNYLSLQESPRFWAKKIIDYKQPKRENKEEGAKRKKYDIIDMARELEEFYLKIN